mmetsp:Transcript_14284/g.31019  ORF Transcript_14284/g.31019 Transcript_14284/m.31019 type:complete len:149 (-) Transcript_14284:222-668(-)
MPTLIIHVDKISPLSGYKEKGVQTQPYVTMKLRKPQFFVFQKDVGDFTTKSKADEVYQEKKSFEVDNLKGVELDVEVYDAHLGEKTVSASFTGAKELSGATHHFLLGSCKVKLGDHGITDDPKGIKVPLSNTFKSSGAEIYLIFTLNP